MLAGMRHTAILGCMLFVVTLAACGGGPSEAEIEATVEARTEEKQTENAALEAKAQAAALCLRTKTEAPCPATTWDAGSRAFWQ